MFQVKNVVKRYGGNIVLNNISLSVGGGMNFVTGCSGSGKTTLFKIMAGIDDDYDGEVCLCDKNVKALSQKEKRALYNASVGFIWQDFNLIENYTALDNILLPAQTNREIDMKRAKKLLSDLKLKDVADKKVKFLSGGQKQRVAIARELMKNPQIIFADEPTSALDKQSAGDIMKILRNIAKDKTVVVITHDISYITPKDTVFELDKGELVSENTYAENGCKRKLAIPKIKVPAGRAFSVLKTNFLRYKGRFMTSVISLMIGVCFLLTMFGDSISGANQSEFDKLFDLYGENVLDISLVHSFIGASGTSADGQENPNVDVEQSLAGLYERYQNDERIEFITYVKPFDNITVQSDGKNYAVESSGNTPVMNKLLAGRLADGSGKEVTVPESLVKKMKLSNEEALGRTITFYAEAVEWNGDIPSFKKVSTEAEIVGVIDASIVTVFEGKKYEYPINDSFFFSKAALDELLKDCSSGSDDLNFLMRAKSPEAMISLKDELNKNGIVPIGNFEVVEDLVCLNAQSEKQSEAAGGLMAALAVVLVGTVALITGLLRKKEYAVFKISGFSNKNLRMLNLIEMLVQTICAFIAMLIFSPLINGISEKIFAAPIVTFENTGVSVLLFASMALLNLFITDIICETTSIVKTFKTGERA